MTIVSERQTLAHMVKDARLTVRIPQTLKSKLEAAAKRERRPLSNYVEKVLAEAVEKDGKGKKHL